MKYYQTYLIFFGLSSGIISSFLEYFGISWDFTFFVFFLLVLDILFNVFFKNNFVSKNLNYTILFVVVFSCFLLFSLFYSSSTFYKFSKITPYFVSICYLIYPYFIKSVNLTLLCRLYLAILFPLSVFFVYGRSVLYDSSSYSSESFYDIRNMYLIVAYNLGIGFLVSVFIKKYFISAVIFLLLFSLGARGPLIFCFLVCLFFFFKTMPFKRFFVVVISGFCVLAIIFFALYSFGYLSIFDVALFRYLSFFSEDLSTNNRLDMFKFVLYGSDFSFFSFLFGKGFGSFGIEYFNVDERAYPHNLFLELFFELGVVGLSVFLTYFVFMTFRAFFSTPAAEFYNLFFFLFLYSFLNSLKTNSFVELWSFYLFFSLMILSCKKKIYSN